MGQIAEARQAQEDAQVLLAGHVDAAHFGDVSSDCGRCVALAADLGLDISR